VLKVSVRDAKASGEVIGEEAGRDRAPGNVGVAFRKGGAILILTGLLCLAMVFSTAVGAVNIPPAEVARIILERLPLRVSGLTAILNQYWPSISAEAHETIIWEIRLPRVVLGALVGMSLATAGATLQGLFRNPMADPYVIGISSGASLGACLAILLSLSFPLFGIGTVPVMAFLGALATVIVVYNLARVGGKVPIMTLLLSGMAVGSFLSAIVSMLLFFGGDKLHQMFFWLLGGLSARNWSYVKAILPHIVLGLGILFAFAREMNLLLLGDEEAAHLGVEVERTKTILLLAASLLTGAAVSVSGLIGFVGLVVPHVMRMVVGPDHRVLLPVAALTGGIFLVTADCIGRVVLPPNEIPVGIITAICGGPFFIYLLRRKRSSTIL